MINKINKSLIWTIGPQFLNYAISLIFTAILSRIILPADYGLIDMVSTVTAFFMIFADGGLAWSILQRKEIVIGEVRNLFWINSLAGMLLTIFCILIAPLVANFYGHSELKNLTIAMSFNFAFAGISILGVAWMKRSLNFKRLAIIDNLVLFVAGGVGIWMAKNGFGYWSLATMALLRSGLKAILILISTREIFGMYDKGTSVKKLLSFGLWVQAYALIGYLYKNIDSVVVGKVWGSEELALYAKAMFIMNLPSMLTVGGLGGFMVSLLSRYQDESIKLQAYYLRCLRIVITLSYPICLFLFVFPSESINFLYGKNWNNAIPVLVAFAGATLLLPIYSTVSWLFLSKGRGRIMVVWSIGSAISYLIAVYLSIDYGAKGVALAYSIVMMGLMVATLTYAHSLHNMSLLVTAKEVVNSIAPPVLAIAVIKFGSLYVSIESPAIFVFTHGLALALLTVAFLLVRYRFGIKTAFLMSDA